MSVALGSGNQAGSSPSGNSYGQYFLQGGTLTVGRTGTGGTAASTDVLAIGNDLGAVGTFTQSGGTLTYNGNLFQLGRRNASGTYNMTGGVINTLINGRLWVGGGNPESGSGTFAQSGGTNNIKGDFIVGGGSAQVGATATGVYSLSGTGLLNVSNSPSSTQIGSGQGTGGAKGTFTQTGGTHTTATSISLGIGAGTNYGEYNLGGGRLTQTTTNAVIAVGNGVGNEGLFNQTGGTLQMAATSGAGLDIGRNGAAGRYTLSGTGVLSTFKVTLNNNANAAAQRNFEMSGGTANVGTFDISGAGSSVSRNLNLYGGTLTTTLVDFGSTSSNRSMSVSGGTQNITNLNLVNSTVANVSGTGNLNITGNLTLGGSATLSTQRSFSIGAAIPTFSNSNIDVGTGRALTFAGAMTYNGGATINKEGGGTLTLAGSQNSTAGATVNVNNGVLNSNTDPGYGLTVNANARLNLNNAGATRLGTLNIGAAGVAVKPNANSVLYMSNLTINPTGQLDLNDNDLVVNNGVFSDIQAQVFSGYSASPDTTKTGIVSTQGQSVAGVTILALYNNALAPAATYPFTGGETVSSTAIIGKYTYIGDADWDGQVTPADYTAVDSNLGTMNVDPGIAWFFGDTDFDYNITPADYTGIDSSLGLGIGNPLSAQGIAAVPEPASIGIITVAGAGMLLRRRRNARG